MKEPILSRAPTKEYRAGYDNIKWEKGVREGYSEMVKRVTKALNRKSDFMKILK